MDIARDSTGNVNSELEDTTSPLLLSNEALTKFPETFTLAIVLEINLLRQEGEDFERKLQGLDVCSTTIRFLGTIQGFVTVNNFADSLAARSAIEITGYKLKKALY
ncbi:unnamed protein product [Tuber aestivum]|uniref:Uncharacterized protein n=1 Tax=Tuber aestivum TaxID=59557 RepID=A0A292PY77_9PEZI|nr:unnamed protein product [Tuber aestivum]